MKTFICSRNVLFGDGDTVTTQMAAEPVVEATQGEHGVGEGQRAEEESWRRAKYRGTEEEEDCRKQSMKNFNHQHAELSPQLSGGLAESAVRPTGGPLLAEGCVCVDLSLRTTALVGLEDP